MKVFIVERGEYGQGGSVLGIFKSLEGAIKLAEKEFDSWNWLTDKVRSSETSWHGGVDYIDITEMDVLE